MNIAFRPTDYSSDIDCETIARWHNDPELQRLWVPTRDENQALPRVTAQGIRERSSKLGAYKPAVDEMAMLGERVVGQVQILLNPPHRKSTAATVAWPSLIIGEQSLRGRGVVRRFGERILTLAKGLNADVIEAAVFEFNDPIRRLLGRAQFEEFARVENMTVRQGKNWADIRYRRPL